MVSLISDRGISHCFTNTQYTTERVKDKKNKQARTWVSSKSKKGEVWALFLHSVVFSASGYRERVSVRNSHTATRNPDSSSHVGRLRSYLLAQQPPLSFPTSVDCPGTLPFLDFFRSRRRSRAQALCVGFAQKQTKESSDWHSPTPTDMNTTHRATLVAKVVRSMSRFVPSLV